MKKNMMKNQKKVILKKRKREVFGDINYFIN